MAYSNDAEEEELVNPQNSNDAEEEELVNPQNSNDAENEDPVNSRKNRLTIEDISDMSTDDFLNYLDGLGDDSSSDTEDNTASSDSVGDVGDDLNNTDNGGDANTDTVNTSESIDNSNKFYKTFNTENDYKADVQSKIDSAFAKRFADNRERDEKYSRLETLAKMHYGDVDNPIDSVIADLEGAEAKKNNMDINSYRDVVRDRIDAQAYRDFKSQADNRAAERNRIISTWKRDADQLKLIDPYFDFDSAVKNKDFFDMLANNKSVFEAYAATKKNSVPPSNSDKVKRKPISQNAQLPRTGTGESTLNPSSLNSSDFMKYIDKIKNS